MKPRAKFGQHSVSSRPVANYEQTFRDLDAIRAFDPQLVILDEAQRIKNWSTRTARTIKKLDVPYRLVLTGTPLMP